MLQKENTTLQKAILLAQAAKYRAARELILDVLEQDPTNEQAWIWLVDVLPNRQRRIQALQRGLTYLPNSRALKLSLQRLRDGLPPVTREADDPRPEPKPVLPPAPRPASEKKKLKQTDKKALPKPPRKPLKDWKGWRWVRLAFSIVLLVAAGIAGTLWMNKRVEQQAFIYSQTATPHILTAVAEENQRRVSILMTISVPTATVTPTPTVTPTVTPTPTTTVEPQALQPKNVASLDESTLLPVGEAYGVAFSPDGETLAIGLENGNIQLWDVSTQELIQTLKQHTRKVYDLAISADGKWLAAASWDKTVSLWDLKTYQQRELLDYHHNLVFGVDFSEDSNYLASAGGNGDVKIWDIKKRKELASLQLTTPAYSLDFFPGGDVIATGSGVYQDENGNTESYVSLWDIAQEDQIMTFTLKGQEIYDLAFSADGSQLLAGTAAGNLFLWDVYNQKELFSNHEHLNAIFGTAFTSHGRMFISADQDGSLYFWDTQGKEIALQRVLRNEGVTFWRIAISADDHFIAISMGNQGVRLIQVEQE